jgi:hypothetical protein
MTTAISPILLSISPTTVEIRNQPTLKFELTLQNVSTKPLTLKGGEPVPEGKQPGGPSSLYLATAGLFNSEQAEDLKIHGSGWNAACFNEGTVTWALCPSSDMTLASNESVTLTIGHGVISGKPRPAEITIDFYLTETIEGVRSLPIMVEGESGPAVPIHCDFLDSRVFPGNPGTPVPSTLYLTLANASPAPLAKTWPEGEPPRIQLSFICSAAPGFGALTTVPHAQAISVAVAPQHQARWKVKQYSEGAFPYWAIEPLPSNPQILGIGAEATLELVISNLITEFPVTAPDPTLASLQLVGFPGYGDTLLKAPIVKVPGPPPSA